MSVEKESAPRDCLGCRIVGAVGLVGIGGYLGNQSFKCKTTFQKVLVSSISFGFIVLGVARYRQTFPFNKKLEA